MGSTTKPRRPYRPKPMLINPVGWVVQGFRPLSAIDDEAIKLKLKNHAALEAVVKGGGTRQHVDTLVAAINMTESLVFTANLGTEYRDNVREASDAIHAMAQRGVQRGDRFIFTGPELQAVNLAWEIHDAQLDACTVRELEDALKYVCHVKDTGKAKRIQLAA